MKLKTQITDTNKIIISLINVTLENADGQKLTINGTITIEESNQSLGG